MPAIVGALIGAGASIYSSSQSKTANKKLQDNLLATQKNEAAAAEQKAKDAESLATANAQAEIKKKRLAQTQTILTSPLGVKDNADLGFKTLLGGG